jgi:hypothetical protein
MKKPDELMQELEGQSLNERMTLEEWLEYLQELKDEVFIRIKNTIKDLEVRS